MTCCGVFTFLYDHCAFSCCCLDPDAGRDHCDLVAYCDNPWRNDLFRHIRSIPTSGCCIRHVSPGSYCDHLNAHDSLWLLPIPQSLSNRTYPCHSQLSRRPNSHSNKKKLNFFKLIYFLNNLLLINGKK